MDAILIPGFWLDGSAWDGVVPALQSAGLRCHALTLPGLESPHADRTGITLADHVDAVVAAMDAVPGPVVLVGHSGGGAMAHAAVDARPDRVTRVVYVDCWPVRDGGVINAELPVVDGENPLPDWSVFGDEDLVDLTDDLRAMFRQRAIPMPARVASDPQRLSDPRRYEVPVTVIACEFTGDGLRAWMDPEHEWYPFFAELASVHDVTIVDLPTGHWPMFTRPAELGEAIRDAIVG